MEVSLCFIIVVFVNIFYFRLYFNYIDWLIYTAKLRRIDDIAHLWCSPSLTASTVSIRLIIGRSPDFCAWSSNSKHLLRAWLLNWIFQESKSK